MASTTAITTSVSDLASVKAEPSSPASSSPATTTTNDSKTSDAPVSAAAPNANANGGQAPAPKRRAARRANTAERRATHNAVERMRRETLNGRFLTLASLLPPLAALRRPSKAAIVSSSIATVHASRRHRVLAAQTLRALSREAEGLRREVNEWRARARVPQLELPVRSEGHATVLRAELEDFDLTLEEGLELEEGDEDGAEEDNDNDNEGVESPVSPKDSSSSSSSTDSKRAHGARARSAPWLVTRARWVLRPRAHTVSPPKPDPATTAQQAHSGRFAFDAPSPPSPSSASSASGGWDGPATPPASAGAGPMMLPLPAMGLPTTMGGMKGYDGKGFYDAPGAAGAAYDLGLGFDGEESLLLGSSGLGVGAGGMIGGWAGASPSHPAFHQQQQQVQQQAIRLREVYEQQQAMLASGMGMGMVCRWGWVWAWA
ncbi:hypothetical protein B0H13DRAFT_241201 [Mycena leptocephala]|nr:hypothetical protein B0H13DRAFT_241201 [Mycena leptocephala]